VRVKHLGAIALCVATIAVSPTRPCVIGISEAPPADTSHLFPTAVVLSMLSKRFQKW
jgi:hypothetical protein